MKIVVTGTRGIPRIQGGVETHCEELYPRLAKLGCDVTLIRRSCYTNNDNLMSYKGVRLKDIHTSPKKSIEAIWHTFLAVIYAKKQRADIVHIHAIGPSIMAPLARLLGLKVVVTNHGPDYDRQKWGKLAQLALKTGEKFGAKYSNQLIVISEVINNIIKEKYHRFDANLIYNGVNIPVLSQNTSYIESLGLTPKKYIFSLGRFVEEKGFDILIKSFYELGEKNLNLVIAGKADHPTKYSEYLRQLAIEKKIILTGFVTGDKLNELFSHARLFVLPSFHEGLPISLLEAMSYGIDVLVSNIPANLAVQLPKECYFKVGNENDLRIRLKEKLLEKIKPTYNLQPYNWDNIAEQTMTVYKKLVNYSL